MKSLKKRIQEEMVLTNEDKLIFEILKEQPNLAKYEKLGRIAYRRILIEMCNKCKRLNCKHIDKPIFTKDWGFRCFIKKEGKKPKHIPTSPKPEIIPSIILEKYLDNAIRKWRNELGISRTKENKLIAKCYIDAYQSVRVSILGETLVEENK